MSEYIPEHCIVYNRPNTDPAEMIDNRDLDWDNEMRVARPQKPISVESNHPMFIIYTSGTTGWNNIFCNNSLNNFPSR